ncbi:MAG: hypothetical protein NTY64_02605 [Deltaproteobacteria bacterium]|nr:hypothetical protein [Deltaproteobacteria bacterium]
MKRTLTVLIALLAMVAFVSGVMAQAPAPKAEKPVVAPAAPAPAPAPAAAKKAEKPKPPKATKASGTVAAFEAGKTIKVKGAKDKEWNFDIAPDAKIKGELKEGAKVTVSYKKDGDKMIATAITVAKAKAEKKEKKEEKK